jgi:hypothetical protein
MRRFIPSYPWSRLKVGSITIIFNSTRQYASITIPLLHIIPKIDPTGALPSGRYDPCVRGPGIKRKHAEPFIIGDAIV